MNEVIDPERAVRKSKIIKATEVSAVDPAARAFGLQMAAIRRSRKLTLDSLATATGLTKGYLSRVERAEKIPSIATVLKLSQAFSVPVSTLFGEAVDDSLIHIVRAKDRTAFETTPNEPNYEPLSKTADGLDAFLLFPPREFGSDGRADHSGTEIMFVVSGVVEVQFPDRSITLAAGDFMQFPGHIAHQVRTLEGNGSVLIAVAREKS